MSEVFGTNIDVEIRINKKTGQYRVTILDSGEKISCADIDADGVSINEKIVKYLAEQIGNAGEAQLTQEGLNEVRNNNITESPLAHEEEEEEEGYNPLDDEATNPYDVGGFGI